MLHAAHVCIYMACISLPHPWALIVINNVQHSYHQSSIFHVYKLYDIYILSAAANLDYSGTNMHMHICMFAHRPQLRASMFRHPVPVGNMCYCSKHTLVLYILYLYSCAYMFLAPGHEFARWKLSTMYLLLSTSTVHAIIYYSLQIA